MKIDRRMTRRTAITAGLAGLGGLVFARYPRELPPTYGHILRMGDAVTYAAQRALLPRQTLVREYSRADVTSFPAIGTTDPGSRRTELGAEYEKLQTDGFKDWKLSVEGRVRNPRTFSLAELKELPSRAGRRVRFRTGGPGIWGSNRPQESGLRPQGWSRDHA